MAIDINVPWDEMRKRKLMIATPMYGGQCYGTYCKSIAATTSLFTKHDVQLRMYFLFNESLITRARTYAVDEFLRSDCTHLLFIDSDIEFDPNDVMAMLAMQDDDSAYDVLCAPYPKKSISWEKIVTAVNKGKADENPNELENYVGDFVFNAKPGTTHISLHDPTEVLESGTGFMMIRRNTFEKIAEVRKDLLFKPDHVRTEHFDGSREIMLYFDTIICPKTKRYLSEDYMFCQMVNDLGMKVWLCPWMKLKHTGTMVFGGSLQHIAEIGASPTADEAVLKNKKRKNNKK